MIYPIITHILIRNLPFSTFFLMITFSLPKNPPFLSRLDASRVPQLGVLYGLLSAFFAGATYVIIRFLGTAKAVGVLSFFLGMDGDWEMADFDGYICIYVYTVYLSIYIYVYVYVCLYIYT